MKKTQEFIVYDGDNIDYISQWLAETSCDISEVLGYDVKKFKIIVSIEKVED